MSGNLLPKISVITPSYNQGEYIEDTIRSILDQKYPNIEYIIIDGGSCDDTVDKIKKFKQGISYWISEPDEGQTHAINKGFKMATGDLITWMNSDDKFYENAFFKVAEKYLKHPEIDVYYADKNHIDNEGICIRSQRYFPFYLHSFLNDKMNMCNQACFWRREVFDKVGFLDEDIQFAMDMDFFIRLGLHKNVRLRHYPEIWGEQRYYEGTKTSNLEWNKLLQNDKKYIQKKYGLKKSTMLKFISVIRRSIYYLKTGNIHYLLGQ